MNLFTFKTFLFVAFLANLASVSGQTPATERISAFGVRKDLQVQSIARNIPFRSVGPTVMSGRVVDIDVNPTQPHQFYVAFASGGLWKTENNGATFTPVFDQEMVMTIGDIAVDWKFNVVWVGTGENNSSRSSYSGTGIYKSIDGCKTWNHMGLPESHHIGRILLDPQNPKVVNVAVLGHLYTPSAERGLYRTIDGGATWSQTLSVSATAGGIDLIADESEPYILYAATWERERKAWNFSGSGAGSAIWKSTDNGSSWKKVSGANSGFPEGDKVGRIGLAAGIKNGKSLIYAIYDNQTAKPKVDKKSDALTKESFRNITKADFLLLPKEKIARFLKENQFPKKYSADFVIAQVKNDRIPPTSILDFLEDANTRLLESDVIGPEIYCSENGGTTWKKTHNTYIDDVFSTYGYYFGQIRVVSNNPDQLYIVGVPILRSDDGGKTFKSINGDNVHGDHHALWINPSNPKHIINGNDGGVNISYDSGENWIKCNTPAVGQFYSIAVDNEEPYNVYGGLQDNGVWVGPSTYEPSVGWHDSGKYPYEFLFGGDGMQVQVDPRNKNTVYTGFQFGSYYRLDRKTEESTNIQPKHELGERPLRFNWQTPIHLSLHQPDVLYLGSNKFHRSLNKGENWDLSSQDLTKGGKPGNVAFGTLSAIHESPLRFGLLYTGSDDGLVHVSKDGGYNWENISTALPQNLWVSRVQASAHKLERVYLSLNGYRNDDFGAYLYSSDDQGKSWNRIGQNLPSEPINVVREDSQNEDLLFVGTDHGVYASLDRGISFFALGKDLPAVAVHDLIIHPKTGDLVVGTHGRSLYIGNIKYLQMLSSDLLRSQLVAYPVSKQRYNSRWGSKRNDWSEARVPKIDLPIYLASAATVSIAVKSEKGVILKSWTEKLAKGVQLIPYDLSIDDKNMETYEKVLNESLGKNAEKIVLEKAKNNAVYLRKGVYQISYEIGDYKKITELVIE